MSTLRSFFRLFAFVRQGQLTKDWSGGTETCSQGPGLESNLDWTRLDDSCQLFRPLNSQKDIAHVTSVCCSCASDTFHFSFDNIHLRFIHIHLLWTCMYSMFQLLHQQQKHFARSWTFATTQHQLVKRCIDQWNICKHTLLGDSFAYFTIITKIYNFCMCALTSASHLLHFSLDSSVFDCTTQYGHRLPLGSHGCGPF